MTAMLRLFFEKHRCLVFADGPDVATLTLLAQCPDFAEIKPSIDFDTAAFCDALCAALKETAGGGMLSEINVDHNAIRSPCFLLDALVRHGLAPSLRTLTVGDNRISDLSFAARLRQFPNLRSVRFAGNPVAARPDYRRALTQCLPSLLDIDGEVVLSRALALPWPRRGQYNERQQYLLQSVEGYLEGLGSARAGPQAMSNSFHLDAVFSIVNNVDLSCTSVSSAVRRAYLSMRRALRHSDRNIVAHGAESAPHMAVGHSAVVALMSQTLYQHGVPVQHQLDGNADVALLDSGDGVKAQVAVITVHGAMAFLHPELPSTEAPLKLTFDRTIVMAHTGTTWEVTNDGVTLRPYTTDDPPVLLGDTPGRLAKVAARLDVPLESVTAAALAAHNDVELYARSGGVCES